MNYKNLTKNRNHLLYASELSVCVYGGVTDQSYELWQRAFELIEGNT